MGGKLLETFAINTQHHIYIINIKNTFFHTKMTHTNKQTNIHTPYFVYNYKIL